MIVILKSKTIRTHRHIRTIHSLLTNTGPGRDRWPRLRETEQIQRLLRCLHKRPNSYKETSA